MPRFKSNIFYYNSPKIKLFCKKLQNFLALGAPLPDPRTSGGWGLCFQNPNFRRLGASPPDPHWPPAAEGSPPDRKIAHLHCKFLATHLVIYCSIILMFWGIIVQVSQYIVMFVCFYCYLSSAVIFYSFIFL